MRYMKRFRSWAMPVLAGVMAAGLALPAQQARAAAAPTIIVGSADFAESQLIATIYSRALRQAGVDVKDKLNIGSREVYIEALKDGSIDLLPEYSGTLLSYFDPQNKATDSAQIHADLEKALPEGIVALDASSAQDVDELVVKKSFAEQHDLHKISDLKPIAATMTLAGPAEWKTRYIGVPGLEQVYGLKFKAFKVLDAGGPLTLSALVNGMAQVGDMFSSDPAIGDNGLVALEDDKGLFGEAAILPIIRADKATPEVRAVLNKISAALNQEDLVKMNGRINDGDDINAIATDWLQAHAIK